MNRRYTLCILILCCAVFGSGYLLAQNQSHVGNPMTIARQLHEKPTVLLYQKAAEDPPVAACFSNDVMRHYQENTAGMTMENTVGYSSDAMLELQALQVVQNARIIALLKQISNQQKANKPREMRQGLTY